MIETSFQIVINQLTHLVVERESERCLGGVGSNFYRPWIFPLYTPSGLTVIQEFPYDHPFHNGFFGNRRRKRGKFLCHAAATWT